MRSIILEGPDNAGKSTLAKKLSEVLPLTVRHSGGPSKFAGEVNERTKSFNEDSAFYIYDRHPAVSQNLYVQSLGNKGELVTPENIQAMYDTNPIIIYCRSNGTLDGHEQSEHSSEEYFKEVEKNYSKLCKLYDAWGLENATFLYRIGDNENDLIRALKGAL